MTKEEALKAFRSYTIWELMDKFTTDELQEMIDAIVSTPSLPSNLDEAARKYGFEEYRRRCEGGEYGTSEDAFKAGAEWMAGQGATCNGEIQMDFSAPADIYARRLSADYWNELGPALMKVEPGKVLIQIRKKQ